VRDISDMSPVPGSALQNRRRRRRKRRSLSRANNRMARRTPCQGTVRFMVEGMKASETSRVRTEIGMGFAILSL